VEYNCIRLSRHDLPPQAGIGICERGPDGLPAAARVYDDVEAPVGQPVGGQSDHRRGVAGGGSDGWGVGAVADGPSFWSGGGR
jgi:hypothetical protein